MPKPSTHVAEKQKLDKLYNDAYKKSGADTTALWGQYNRDKKAMAKRLYSRGYISIWKDKYKPDVPIEGEGYKERHNTSNWNNS
jgi:hypothetical protein